MKINRKNFEKWFSSTFFICSLCTTIEGNIFGGGGGQSAAHNQQQRTADPAEYISQQQQHNNRKMQMMSGFVHTFETKEACERSCARPPCLMQVMEELEMMQRWVCDPSPKPSVIEEEDGDNVSRKFGALNDDDGDEFATGRKRTHENGGGGSRKWRRQSTALLNHQFLLMLFPLAFFLILCIILGIRKCATNASSIAIV